MKFINFYIFLDIFALLDPDPIRIQIRNTGNKQTWEAEAYRAVHLVLLISRGG